MADPKTRCDDQTITGLRFATLVKNRLGNRVSARKHAIAARNMVYTRYENDSDPEETSMPTFCILVAIGLDAQALSHRSLRESKIKMFVTDLTSLQRWALQATRLFAISLLHNAKEPSGLSDAFLFAQIVF